MNKFMNKTELLLDMLTAKDVITYEVYKKRAGDERIGRVEWDNLLTIVGTRQMLYSEAMRDVMNKLNETIKETREKQCQTGTELT